MDPDHKVGVNASHNEIFNNKIVMIGFRCGSFGSDQRFFMIEKRERETYSKSSGWRSLHVAAILLVLVKLNDKR